MSRTDIIKLSITEVDANLAPLGPTRLYIPVISAKDLKERMCIKSMATTIYTAPMADLMAYR